MAAYVFIGKRSHINGPTQFKLVLLKGQRYITNVSCAFFTFINMTTRKILIARVVGMIFLLDCNDPEGRDKNHEDMRTQNWGGRFMRQRSPVAGD